MNYCLYCNGMTNRHQACPHCDNILTDLGKVYDFYDDYSPYMDIDLNKLVDGDPLSSKKSRCVHLFACSICGKEKETSIPYGEE